MDKSYTKLVVEAMSKHDTPKLSNIQKELEEKDPKKYQVLIQSI